VSTSKNTPRVRLIDPGDAGQELAEVYAAVARSRGGLVGNVFQALGASPQSLEVVAALGAQFRNSAVLGPPIKELVVLAVADEVRCEYEWAHHWRAARKLGRAGDESTEHLTGSRDPSVASAVCIARATATGRDVDDEVMAAARSHHGEQGLVDIVVMAAYYLLLSRVIQALQVPLETWAERQPFPGET
jgi:4-carboxymuconolactone decarboxylase